MNAIKLVDLTSFDLSPDGQEVTVYGTTDSGQASILTLTLEAQAKAIEALLAEPIQSSATDGIPIHIAKPPLKLTGVHTAKGSNGMGLLLLRIGAAGQVPFAISPANLPTLIEALQGLNASMKGAH